MTTPTPTTEAPTPTLDLDAIEQRAIAAGAGGWWEPADLADLAAALRAAFLGYTHAMANADARHIIAMSPNATLIMVDKARRAETTEAARGRPIGATAMTTREPEVSGLETARIVITRTLTPDDNDVHGVEATPGMSLVEALGMLALAASSLLEHPPGLGDDDEDDQ